MSRNEYNCDCNMLHKELVEATLAAMPKEDVLCALSEFHKIIGDLTRCKLIFALLEQEMCVCDLANILSMTKSSISHQLSKMKECGVVKCRKEGKSVYYSLDDHHVAEIFSLSLRHISHKIKE